MDETDTTGPDLIPCNPYDPVADQTHLSAVPATEARTRLWHPRKPGERNGELWVNQGAGGLGDALLGLCAVRGLRKLHPNQRIIYRIPIKWAPFVALFDGGYDGLAEHEWDHTHDIPYHLDPRDLQLNDGYAIELNRKSPQSRIDRYCNNLGRVTPEIPPLRDPGALMAAGRWFAGLIVLAPFSAWRNREWPLRAWQTLETHLNRAVVLGQKDRSKVFRSRWVDEMNAVGLTALLMNCACLVSNDNGAAHLASILGTRTVVLCGPTRGESVYGCYQNTTALNGNLACASCYYSAPYVAEQCEPMCASLASISVDRVLAALQPAKLPLGLNGEAHEHRPGTEAEPDRQAASAGNRGSDS